MFFLCARLPSRLAQFSGLLVVLVIAERAFAPANPVILTYNSPVLPEFVAGIWIGAWINRGTALPSKGGA